MGRTSLRLEPLEDRRLLDASIVISKAALAEFVEPGADLTYLINVSNDGPDPFNNPVRLVDVIPDNTTFKSIEDFTFGTGPFQGVNSGVQGTELNVDPLEEGDPAGSVLYCTASSLDVFAFGMFAVTVTVNPDVEPGTVINNTAIIEQFDPVTGLAVGDPLAVGEAEGIPVQVPPPGPDLSVTKSAEVIIPEENPQHPAGQVAVGDTVVFTINYGNALDPDVAATGVVLTEFTPEGTEFDEGAAGNAGWQPVPDFEGWYTMTVGNLAPGAAGVATFTVTVTFQPVTDEIENTVTIEDDRLNGRDPVADNNQHTLSLPFAAEPEQFDLSVAKTATNVTTETDLDEDDSVAVGDLIEYQITVHNAGPDAATGVVVTDTVPAGMTVGTVGATEGFEFDVVGNTVTFTATEPLASGAQVVLIVQATVDPGTEAGTALDNLVVVTPADTTTPTTPENNTDNFVLYVSPSAELWIEKDAVDELGEVIENPSIVAGMQGLVRVRVGNDGPHDAAGLVVRESIPAGIAADVVTVPDGFGAPDLSEPGFVKFTSNPGWSLASGEFVDFVFQVTVLASTLEGTVINTASVSAAGIADPGVRPNVDTLSTTVTTDADVWVTKAALDGGDGSVVAGTEMAYEITLHNDGPSDAAGVVITDTLPEGVVYTGPRSFPGFDVDVIGQVVTLTATGPIAPTNGTPVVITLPVLVLSGVPEGEISNSVCLTSDNDDNPGNNDPEDVVTTVTTEAAVSVSKVAKNAQGAVVTQIVAGQDLFYEITVHNAGPSDAQGVVVTDTPPVVDLVHVTSIEATPPAGFALDPTAPEGQIRFIPVDGTTVAADASVVFTIRLTTNNTLQDNFLLHNEVEIVGDNDVSAGDDTAQVDVDLLGGQADLGIAKQAPASVIAGQTLTYTFTVQNAGPTDAQNVVVTDMLPAGTTFVAASAPGFTITAPAVGAGGTVRFTKATMANGATATLTITVATNPNVTTGMINNRATVGSDTNDLNPANDNSPLARTQIVASGITGLTVSPLDPTKMDLVIGGTDAQAVRGGTDVIVVLADPRGGVRVAMNGKLYGPYTPTGRIVVYGRGGNDVISVSPTVAQSAWLFGGDGTDVLIGGGGDDVLMGGAGTDTLVGGRGRNLLIGGLGSDVLNGAVGDNILVGGTTAHDASDVALNALMSEWTRRDLPAATSYLTRVQHLKGIGVGNNGAVLLKATLPGATVLDDAARDTLVGGSRGNWYFQKLTGTAAQRDLVVSRWPTEMVEYLI